eukprot:403355415
MSYSYLFDLIIYGGTFNSKPFIGLYQNKEQYYGTITVVTLKSSNANIQLNRVVTVGFSLKDLRDFGYIVKFAVLFESKHLGASLKDNYVIASFDQHLVKQAAARFVADFEYPYSPQQFLFDKDDCVIIIFANNRQGFIARIDSAFTQFLLIKQVGTSYFNYQTALQYYPGQFQSYLFFASLGNGDWNNPTSKSWLHIGCLNLENFLDDLSLSRSYYKVNIPVTKDLAVQILEINNYDNVATIYGCLGNLQINQQTRNQIGFVYYSQNSVGQFYYEYSNNQEEKLTCIGIRDVEEDENILLYYQYQKQLLYQEILIVNLDTKKDLINLGQSSDIELVVQKLRFKNENVQIKINQMYARNFESRTISFLVGEISTALGFSAGFVMNDPALFIHYRAFQLEFYGMDEVLKFDNLGTVSSTVTIINATSQSFIQLSATIEQEDDLIDNLKYWPSTQPDL